MGVKDKKSKPKAWTVDIEVDRATVRYNWLGRERPDGYLGRIYEDGVYRWTEFGATREEVATKARKSKAEILDARERRANPETVTL